MGQTETLGAYILAVVNTHHESCGNPPRLRADSSSRFRAYLENDHHEQWLCYEDDEGRLVLQGGEIGWERVVVVLAHPDAPILDSDHEHLVLRDCEKLFLQACIQSWAPNARARMSRT